MGLLCTYQSWPWIEHRPETAPASGFCHPFLGGVYSVSCAVPLAGICAVPWFWEEALRVEGQEKTKKSGDKKAGAEVPFGTRLASGVILGVGWSNHWVRAWWDIPNVDKKACVFLQLPCNLTAKSCTLYVILHTSRRSWMVKICCLCAANCSILSKPGHINYRKLKWWWWNQIESLCFSSSYNMRLEGKNNTTVWTENE